MKRSGLIVIGWIAVFVAIGFKAIDFTLRAKSGGLAAVLPWDGVYLYADISTAARTVVTSLIASVLLIRARDVKVAGAGVVMALYGNAAAFSLLGEQLRSHSSVLFLSAFLIASLNFAATKYFQSFPAPVTRLRLSRLLRLFSHNVALGLFSAIPLIIFMLPRGRDVALAAWSVSIIALQFAYLRLNLNADAEYRKRLFWVAEGLLLILLVVTLTPLISFAIKSTRTAFDPRAIQWLVVEIGHTGALACFAIAVFFYDATDAGIVVNRTIAAGLASSASLVLFIGMETLLSEGFASVINAQSRTASIIAGVLAALAFKPIESRARRLFPNRME